MAFSEYVKKSGNKFFKKLCRIKKIEVEFFWNFFNWKSIWLCLWKRYDFQRHRTPKLYRLYFVSGGKDNYGVCDDNWIESICSRKTFIGIWQRHLTQRRGHSYKFYFNLKRLENYRYLFQLQIKIAGNSLQGHLLRRQWDWKTFQPSYHCA